MKPRPVLLACVLLTAAFNLALDLSQQARLATFTAAWAEIRPREAADPAPDDGADPAIWRNLARTEHDRRESDDQLLTVLLGSVRRMNAAAVWRSGVLVALALALTAASLRTKPPGGMDQGAADPNPPPF